MSPIRPWLAGLYAFFCPGLGHIYAGQARFAVPILLVPQIVYMGLLSLAVYWDEKVLEAFQGAILIMVAIFVGQVIWAVLLARRATEEDQLRRYRIFPAYLAYFGLSLLVTQAVSDGPFRPNVLEPFRIQSSSMAPALLQGDHVLVTKLGPRNKNFKRGDVVAFVNPHGDDVWVKRVVALPGDRVQVRDDGSIVLNDVHLENESCGEKEITYTELVLPDEDAGPVAIKEAMEKGSTKKTGRCFTEKLPGQPPHRVMHLDGEEGGKSELGEHGREVLTIEEGRIFVLGDNRFFSKDSRSFGPIYLQSVVGRVHSVFYSVDPNGGWRMDRIGQRGPGFLPP
jgi:signal peptidase I